MGDWTLVYKKGDKQEENNYRPITSLIVIDNIFENLLAKQITNRYDAHLYYQMTAYRKSEGCETTLLRLVEDWKTAIDNNKSVVLLSTDMSKAFDSLSFPLLIKKLEAYGFERGAIKVMRSCYRLTESGEAPRHSQ